MLYGLVSITVPPTTFPIIWYLIERNIAMLKMAAMMRVNNTILESGISTAPFLERK